jgi:transposase
LVQKAHARILKGLNNEIAKLEAAISAKVKSTSELAERVEILESVPGLGKISATNLVAGMPELGQVSDKIAAAFGVAPYDDDSGKRCGERHVKAGRRWILDNADLKDIRDL